MYSASNLKSYFISKIFGNGRVTRLSHIFFFLTPMQVSRTIARRGEPGISRVRMRRFWVTVFCPCILSSPKRHLS